MTLAQMPASEIQNRDETLAGNVEKTLRGCDDDPQYKLFKRAHTIATSGVTLLPFAVNWGAGVASLAIAAVAGFARNAEEYCGPVNEETLDGTQALKIEYTRWLYEKHPTGGVTKSKLILGGLINGAFKRNSIVYASRSIGAGLMLAGFALNDGRDALRRNVLLPMTKSEGSPSKSRQLAIRFVNWLEKHFEANDSKLWRFRDYLIDDTGTCRNCNLAYSLSCQIEQKRKSHALSSSP